jgi:hypothetical protein
MPPRTRKPARKRLRGPVRKRLRGSSSTMQAMTFDDLVMLRPKKLQRRTQDDADVQQAFRLEPPSTECPKCFEDKAECAATKRCKHDTEPTWTVALYLGNTVRAVNKMMSKDAQRQLIRRLNPDPRDVLEHMRLIYSHPLFLRAVHTYIRMSWAELIIPPFSFSSAVGRARLTKSVKTLMKADPGTVEKQDLGLVLFYLMMTAQRLRKPAVFFRGQGTPVPWDDGETTRVSNRILSASTDGATALGFGSDSTMFVYNVARGVPCLILPVLLGHETEVLLPPGLPMRLVRLKRNSAVGYEADENAVNDEGLVYLHDRYEVNITAPF